MCENPNQENIKVAVRIRPLSKIEEANGSKQIEYTIDGNIIYLKDYGFGFDYFFEPNIDQETLYQSTIQENMLPKLFQGYNVTVFVFGQTGSGKTYTMGTNYSRDSHMGIIQRAIRDIFEHFEEHKDIEFGISVSFLEIYNETIYDLLSDKSRDQSIVDIREENREVKCVGLTERSIASCNDGFNVLMLRSKNRFTASTAMNETSSRSHAIFTITLTFKNVDDPHVITSKFHLVDLAGSERHKKAEAQGDRFREDVNINLSLLSLGNVISALSNDNTKNSFVPYRDSKLTRLLQNSLGGNSVTLMIACISSAVINVDETLSTLRYAHKVKNIKNKPVINKNLEIREIASLKEYIGELQSQLKRFENLQISNEDSIKDKLTIATLEKQLEASAFNGKVYQLIQSLSEIGKEIIETGRNSNDSGFKNKMIDLTNLLDQYLKEKNDIDNYANLNSLETEIKLREKEASLKQCKYSFVLKEIDLNIQKKDQEIRHVEHKSEMIHKLAEKSLTNKIELQKLRLEYDGIIEKIKEMKATQTSSKAHIQRRVRQTELEVLIADLSKKIVDQEGQIKQYERDTKVITKLYDEIRQIKQEKIKLVKQMQAEIDTYRQWKIDKEQEINQLKSFNRKRIFFKNENIPQINCDSDQENEVNEPIITLKYACNSREIIDISLKNSKNEHQTVDEIAKLNEMRVQLQNYCKKFENDNGHGHGHLISEKCKMHTIDNVDQYIACNKAKKSQFLANLNKLMRS